MKLLQFFFLEGKFLTYKILITVACIYVAGTTDLHAVFADEKESDAKSTFTENFNEIDSAEWKVTGFTDGATVKDGILSLKTPGGVSKVISFLSVKKFIFASLEARIKFSKVGKGSNHYLGFIGKETWSNPNERNAAWLMDVGSTKFQFYAQKDGEAPSWVIAQQVKAEIWYTIKMDWKAENIKLYVDGKLCGAVKNKKSIPTEAMPIVFEIFTNDSTPMQMDIDYIKLTGKQVKEAPRQKVVVTKEAPLPPKPVINTAVLSEKAPSIKADMQGAVLENKYYKYDLKFQGGPQITALINKTILGKNQLLSAPSRLFLLHKGKTTFPNRSFKLLNQKVEKKGDGFLLKTIWESYKYKGINVELTLKVDDSPQLSGQIAIKNNSSSKIISSVSFPVLEHLKIGDKIEDDALFYPSETGLCGTGDGDFRGIFGYSLWMQIMMVFDPVAGGGVYMFAKDSEATPKILLIRRKSKANIRIPYYSEIWWTSQDPGKIYDQLLGSSMIFKTLDFELDPGKKGTSAEMIVGVNRGDWHEPMKAYRKFVRTWYKRKYAVPQWYMDTYTYLSGHPSAGLHLANRYNDLTTKGGGYYDHVKRKYRYADEMKLQEINSLMEIAFWWDYNLTPEEAPKYVGTSQGIGKYNIGDYNYSKARGGQKTLKEEIRRIHAKKGRLMLYCYPEAVSCASNVFKKYGMKLAAMSEPGVYATRFAVKGKSCNYCIYSAEFKNYFAPLITSRVKGIDADGVRLDVLSYLFPCYNPAHKHYNGTFRSTIPVKRVNELLLACLSEMRKRNPEAIVTTEHAGSEYLTQNSDGFLAQTKSWYAHPAFEMFRPFDQYRLNFFRFLLPEVKIPMAGIRGSVNDKIQMGLFNANIIVVTLPPASIIFDSLRENGDAINSLIQPEAYIPTIPKKVYANYFPGKKKNLWTIYNRSNKNFNGQVIEIPFKENVHYIEVLNDTEVNAQKTGNGNVRLSLAIEKNKTMVVVEMAKRLTAEIRNGKIKVAYPAKGKYLSLQVSRAGNDHPGKRKKYNFANGTAIVDIPQGNGKIVIKAIKDYCLLDEIIL